MIAHNLCFNRNTYFCIRKCCGYLLEVPTAEIRKKNVDSHLPGAMTLCL